MKWSVSSARVFSQCPKKWYLETFFADSRSENPERREAHFLKHLQSIYAWRGKLVDQVISRQIIPKINKHEQIDSTEIIAYAHRLLDSQLEFAKARTYRNGCVKTDSYNYCALQEFENGCNLAEESIGQIWREVETSLRNLLVSPLFQEISSGAFYLVAQRSLQFHFANLNIRCTPDLIAFPMGNSPIIVDWKTDFFEHKEHWLQLGIYGFALSRISPHRDFPHESLPSLAFPTAMRLVEVQLLRNRNVNYSMTDEDVIDIEDYIYTSSTSMQLLTNGCKTPELLVQFMPRAKSPEVCLKCKFKKICNKVD